MRLLLTHAITPTDLIDSYDDVGQHMAELMTAGDVISVQDTKGKDLQVRRVERAKLSASRPPPNAERAADTRYHRRKQALSGPKTRHEPPPNAPLAA